MSAILIQATKSDLKLLQQVAERLGAKVTKVKEEQIEDLALGAMMDQVKTGEPVPRERIMKKLKSFAQPEDPLLALAGRWKDRDMK